MRKCHCNACGEVVTFKSNRMDSHIRICTKQTKLIGQLRAETEIQTTLRDEIHENRMFSTPVSASNTLSTQFSSSTDLESSNNDNVAVSKQPSILVYAERWSLEQQAKAANLFARAIHLNCLPFAMFDKPEWKDFFGSLRNPFQVPQPEVIGGKFAHTSKHGDDGKLINTVKCNLCVFQIVYNATRMRDHLNMTYNAFLLLLSMIIIIIQ